MLLRQTATKKPDGLPKRSRSLPSTRTRARRVGNGGERFVFVFSAERSLSGKREEDGAFRSRLPGFVFQAIDRPAGFSCSPSERGVALFSAARELARARGREKKSIWKRRQDRCWIAAHTSSVLLLPFLLSLRTREREREESREVNARAGVARQILSLLENYGLSAW